MLCHYETIPKRYYCCWQNNININTSVCDLLYKIKTHTHKLCLPANLIGCALTARAGDSNLQKYRQSCGCNHRKKLSALAKPLFCCNLPAFPLTSVSYDNNRQSFFPRRYRGRVMQK